MNPPRSRGVCLLASAFAGFVIPACAPGGGIGSEQVQPEPASARTRMAISAGRTEYTSGHADIAFAAVFDEEAWSFEVNLVTDGATVDGVPGVSAEFPIDDVRVTTTAAFTRPSPDGGFFAPLCVPAGGRVHWLPQNNTQAAPLGVPFLGFESSAAPGLFVDDRIELMLVGVEAPGGVGHHALWKDGLPPIFAHSSCDGIDGADRLLLPLGHDHFNLGFAGPAGVWHVSYDVRAELAPPLSGQVATPFEVEFEVGTAAAVPALEGVSVAGLALGLICVADRARAPMRGRQRARRS